MAGFFGGGGGEECEVLLFALEFVVDFALEFEDVIGTQSGEGVGVVTMQVDECAKGFLFATGEVPIDGAFFVGLDVVFDKFIKEVATDAIAWVFACSEGEGDRDVVEVGLEVLGAVGGFEEFDDLVYDVVGEVGFVGDGDYGGWWLIPPSPP